MVWLTVAHTVVGALVLAGAVVVALVCFRILNPAREAALASHSEAAPLRLSR